MKLSFGYYIICTVACNFSLKWTVLTSLHVSSFLFTKYLYLSIMSVKYFVLLCSIRASHWYTLHKILWINLVSFRQSALLVQNSFCSKLDGTLLLLQCNQTHLIWGTMECLSSFALATATNLPAVSVSQYVKCVLPCLPVFWKTMKQSNHKWVFCKK